MTTQTSVHDPRVIVALDYPTAETALAMASRLNPAQCRVKVGKELFTAAGPALVERLVGMGYGVFLDLKYHDIPNTVASACRVAAGLGVWMMNVHASGGSVMMRAAREEIENLPQRPLLIAVTVLTSMGADDLREIGCADAPAVMVERLAALAENSGMDGVVCSAQEATALRRSRGTSFRLVTPGIRLPDAAADDQKRVLTPQAAVAAGADYLVIGRPITKAQDPLKVLAQITASLA